MALTVLKLVHLIGFAAFVGGAFAQQRFMKMSAASGAAAAVRDAYEKLASAVCSKIELPGIFTQVLSGVAILVLAPGFLKQHWMHAKLTAVVLALVTSHVEMINAKKIVRARAEKGDAADGEIAARKKRQASVGVFTGILIGAILLLATVLRDVM
jgi:uncharacterized membrane protein